MLSGNLRQSVVIKRSVAESALANQAPALNTQSLTRDLGNEKSAYDTEATRRAALTAYLAEQEAAGLDYDAAWAKAKVERADIFANMARKSRYCPGPAE